MKSKSLILGFAFALRALWYVCINKVLVKREWEAEVVSVSLAGVLSNSWTSWARAVAKVGQKSARRSLTITITTYCNPHENPAQQKDSSCSCSGVECSIPALILILSYFAVGSQKQNRRHFVRVRVRGKRLLIMESNSNLIGKSWIVEKECRSPDDNGALAQMKELI